MTKEEEIELAWKAQKAKEELERKRAREEAYKEREESVEIEKIREMLRGPSEK
jgi:hypothetical protein